MEHLITQYANWIKDNYVIRELDSEWHEVVTPFLDSHNDLIEIYLKQEGNSILLSDGGNTLQELRMSGVIFDSQHPNRQHELENILRCYGITNNTDNELVVYADANSFPKVKHRFIQAILSIYDLSILAQPKVENRKR